MGKTTLEQYRNTNNIEDEGICSNVCGSALLF